jgi:hypothetical protein
VIERIVCFTLTCDDGCEYPWGDDGPWHLTSPENAIEAARIQGWLIVGDLTVCPDCAARRECAATGHQYPENWTPMFSSGVSWRYRSCGHCDNTVHDPPWDELVVLMDAAEAASRGLEEP